MKRYDELDGIRGAAFLLVLMGHIFSNNPHILPYIVGIPKFGVWMFFVLSSFLLSNYFLSNPERVSQPTEWGNYLVRRFMRIYPLYAVILVIYFIWHRSINSLSVIRDHLLLQKGYMQLWTMPIEMTFYLILPIVIFAIVWLGRMNLKVTLSITAIFIVVHQIFYPFTEAVENSTNVMQYLPVFVFGSVGALIHQKLLAVELTKKMKYFLDGLALVTVIVLVMVTPYPMKHIFGHEPDRYLMNKFIFIGFACLVFMISVMHGSVVKQLFSNRFMRFIGKISYGGYLIHWLFVEMIIGQYFKGLTFISGILTFILSIVSASIFYFVIERPCMKVSLIQREKKNNGIKLAAQ